VKDPTPGKDSSPAASAEGTNNNASPQSGWRVLGSYFKDSPVKTYLYDGGDEVGQFIVNVTQKGHPLHPGYVVRGVTKGAEGNAVVQNYGEGTGLLQDFGKLSDVLFNNVWYPHSQENIDNALGGE